MSTAALLGIGIPFFYLMTGLLVYRRTYVIRYTQWQRWVNEAPDRTFTFPTDSGDVIAPRSEVSYSNWLWKSPGIGDPPGLIALFWPLYLLAKPLHAFLRPDVKIPSVPKIDELEKL
jgi:hypothetical protein